MRVDPSPFPRLSKREAWQKVRAHLAVRNDPEGRRRLREQDRARAFGRMNGRTRRAIESAEGIALEHDADLLDTGYLLAGLVALNDGVAGEICREVGLEMQDIEPRLSRPFSDEDAAALATLGISLEDIVERTRQAFGSDAWSRVRTDASIWAVPTTLEFSSVLGAAIHEARLRNAEQLQPEHLLSALLADTMHDWPTAALAIMYAAGVDPQRLRALLYERIGPRPAPRRYSERLFYPKNGSSGTATRFMQRVYAKIAPDYSEHRLRR